MQPPPQPSTSRDPQESLAPNAKRVWIIGDLIGTSVLTLIVLGAALLGRWLADLHWIWAAIPAAVVLALGLAWTIITPPIRYNQWRYAIREDEVDLAHGILVKTRQIVPMARIQHVDTTRGPVQRRYGLASVVFYTAAGALTIPELTDEQATAVRDRIASLAKVHDDL